MIIALGGLTMRQTTERRLMDRIAASTNGLEDEALTNSMPDSGVSVAENPARPS